MNRHLLKNVTLASAAVTIALLAALSLFKTVTDDLDNRWVERQRRSPGNLYAWAYDLNAAQIGQALRHFDGLGAVLYATNYDVAQSSGRWIAYVTSVDDAKTALQYASTWDAFIIGDELNLIVSPESYRNQFDKIASILKGHGPISTQGLRPIGRWWHTSLWMMRYDGLYAEQLPDADLQAFNPNFVRIGELRRLLRTPHSKPWILSPAPFNDPLKRWLQPIKLGTWLAVAEHDNVFAVALWNLVQKPGYDGRTYQPHGLIDRKGRLTSSGKRLQSYLAETDPE